MTDLMHDYDLLPPVQRVAKHKRVPTERSALIGDASSLARTNYRVDAGKHASYRPEWML